MPLAGPRRSGTRLDATCAPTTPSSPPLEVVRRIAAFKPPATMHDAWRRFVDGMALPEEISALLLDPAAIDDLCETLGDLGLARQAHACTHMTIAPTIVHGGTKINVIPDQVELDLDVRTLPGQTEADVRSVLAEAIGDLGDKVEIVWAHDDPASESPVGTPLWDELDAMVRRFHPGAESVPFFTAGATDARFFRRRGVGRLRLRDVLGPAELRTVPVDVPRGRRTRRRRVAGAVRRDVRGAPPLVPELSPSQPSKPSPSGHLAVRASLSSQVANSAHDLLHTSARPLDDLRETFPVVPERRVELCRRWRLLASPQVAAGALPVELPRGHPGDELADPCARGRDGSAPISDQKREYRANGSPSPSYSVAWLMNASRFRPGHRAARHAHQGPAGQQRVTGPERARPVGGQLGRPRPFEERVVERLQRQSGERGAAQHPVHDELHELERRHEARRGPPARGPSRGRAPPAARRSRTTSPAPTRPASSARSHRW